MTPEETQLLGLGGELFVRDLAYTVPLTLFYGLYALLAYQALHSVLSRSKTKFSWILVALLLATFLITTTYFCLYQATVFVLIQTALVKNPELTSLDERFTIASDSILRLSIAQLWLGGVNGLLYMFGDGIVVWRAAAVWTERRSVIIVPAFFLLATFAIFITSSTLRTIAFVNPSDIEPASLFGSLVIAGYCASVATNFSSTLLIGIKAYQHRKFIKAIGMGSSKAAKVLMLLTESGVVYIAFQVVNVCMAFLDESSNSNSSFNIASHVWGVIMNFVAALYPTLIVLIIHHSRSISHLTTENLQPIDGHRPSPENKSNLFSQTHISFAPVTSTGTANGVTENTFGTIRSEEYDTTMGWPRASSGAIHP